MGAAPEKEDLSAPIGDPEAAAGSFRRKETANLSIARNHTLEGGFRNAKALRFASLCVALLSIVFINLQLFPHLILEHGCAVRH